MSAIWWTTQIPIQLLLTKHRNVSNKALQRPLISINSLVILRDSKVVMGVVCRLDSVNTASCVVVLRSFTIAFASSQRYGCPTTQQPAYQLATAQSHRRANHFLHDRISNRRSMGTSDRRWTAQWRHSVWLEDGVAGCGLLFPHLEQGSNYIESAERSCFDQHRVR